MRQKNDLMPERHGDDFEVSLFSGDRSMLAMVENLDDNEVKEKKRAALPKIPHLDHIASPP